ncbi:MAG: hypothetical protein SXA11_18510 [Cyanobacteriota bacterium]|nr:hypothetical protein [Cyanobacteriota bacterium]
MQKLYEYILEEIEKSSDFYDSKISFEEYLFSLQKPAKLLWTSYRSNRVKVDYSKPQFQAAYLIRYYPHYVEMTLEVLEKCSEFFAFGRKINVCFFGAGPCPELLGLALYLKKYSPQTTDLAVNIYDLASKEWKPSRNITYKVHKSLCKGKGRVNVKATNLDLCSANSLEKISKTTNNSHLFVFQNCLNEIWNKSATQNNIKFLLDRAPKDSFIIIADLLYDQSRKIVKNIAKTAEERRDYKILEKCDEMTIQSSFTLPEIIEENLLTGENGLIPKKRINFFFLALKKIRYSRKII